MYPPHFQDFNFSVLDDPDFKEDAVREELILPILKGLNYKPYGTNKIVRSKTLTHPFIKTGSKKRKITLIPDYLFQVNGDYTWVLDAKSPNQDIKTEEHLAQVYSYATHPDIRTEYFALCNGRDFLLQKIDKKEPVLYFSLTEIDKYWPQLKQILAPDIFIQNKLLKESQAVYQPAKPTFDYLKCKLLPELPVRKRAAKRHFGVHGYFTKQSWNVVQEYIKNFTQPNDVVLDSFGGSGVTLVEALMTGRKGIHTDINPMSVFIVSSLLAPVKLDELSQTFIKVKNEFAKFVPTDKASIKESMKMYFYPKGNRLMKNADVETVEELFSDRQLAQLGLLKHLIGKVKDNNIQKSLLLAFSTSITKLNLTYHNSKVASPNAGDCAAFRYYRYRMAKKTVDLDVWKTFEGKYNNIVKAKKEIAPFITQQNIKNATIKKWDATNLDFIEKESVDYIYTDPPYGNKIPYLDLSVMWNAWLDLEVTEEDFQKEAIEGGSRNKTSEEYSHLLTKSISEMYRVLKFNRWMSFVFAHKNPKYWHLIIDVAEKVGFEYVGAVKQPNGQTSYKKRTKPFSVLAGQLIINFRKVRTPQAIQKVNLGVETYEIIIETIESVIAANDGATLEQINDELILKGLEYGFLDVLSKEYKDLTPILLDNFDYDEKAEQFFIRQNKQFKTSIPLDLRIRYFLISYLRRKEKEQKYPTTDEIILDIMPLLKNGITPENQTILVVLEKLANKIKDDRWQIKTEGQAKLRL